MLFDMRVYQCRPGTIRKQLELYREFGWEAQVRALGQPFGYFQTETGDPNTYVHIWQYQDAADRTAKRAAMAQDPAWQTFLAKGAEAGYLVDQKNSHVIPVPFWTPPSR